MTTVMFSPVLRQANNNIIAFGKHHTTARQKEKAWEHTYTSHAHKAHCVIGNDGDAHPAHMRNGEVVPIVPEKVQRISLLKDCHDIAHANQSPLPPKNLGNAQLRLFSILNRGIRSVPGKHDVSAALHVTAVATLLNDLQARTPEQNKPSRKNIHPEYGDMIRLLYDPKRVNTLLVRHAELYPHMTGTELDKRISQEMGKSFKKDTPPGDEQLPCTPKKRF